MSVSPRPFTASALAAVAFLAGACGGGSASSTTPRGSPGQAAAPAPEAISVCARASPRWRQLRVGSLRAAALGDARDGVVFLNESGNDACPWLPLAQRLAARGYRAAVFDYRSTAAAGERRAVRDALAVAAALARDRGRLALVGASLGGRIVFEAAAAHDVRVAAIVSLSGERVVEARQPHQLLRAVRSTIRRLVPVPGTAHGTDLLVGADGRALSARIEAFVVARLG